MDVYQQIKRQNGEVFAKTIRDFHDGIFEIPNIVEIVKYAGRDAEPILPYLISLKDKPKQLQDISEDPISLLKKAHYNAYYVTNLEEQNAIEKYFPQKERLCTFDDPNRYKENYIINCVKENVDEIKRPDKPQREDDYAVSVLSIQISKKTHVVSIICRYNHKVSCPNNTYESNLDEIIPGLASSVQKHFNITFNENQFSLLPRGYVLTDKHVLHYKIEVNDTYIGKDFYVKDGKINLLNKDYQIMLEESLLDLKKRTITNLSSGQEFSIDNQKETDVNSLASILAAELKGKKIIIKKEKDLRHIYADDALMLSFKDSSIVYLNLPTTKEIGNFILRTSKELKKLVAPQLESVGRSFLYYNNALQGLYLPKLRKAGDSFLCVNEGLQIINVPKLEEVGDNFMLYNKALRKAAFPNLRKVGDGFLCYNGALNSLDMPVLEETGNAFLQYNLSLKSLYMPNLKKMGYGCLLCNEILEKFCAPKLVDVKKDFYYSYAAHLMKQKQRE